MIQHVERRAVTGEPGRDAMAAHMEQMRLGHMSRLWVHFGTIALGCWLLSSPATLGYLEPGNFGPEVARITAERNLAPPEIRAAWMMWSDLLNGALLVMLGTLSLSWRWRYAQWGTCLVGIWLLFAPLLLWAPDAASYANDTLIGALAIAFAILIPMMPGMSTEGMMQRGYIPPGWDYSPSTWSQRLPIIALAFIGFFLARYMTAYQLGHISTVWDPFFGDGTHRIITSDVSRAWPVADAGLGAVTYMIEALSGMMGDRRRWRTMPWMVGMFGLLVIPLGGVSIFFIIIQPIVIGTWCTLCLVSAAAMVIMLPYSFDEILAMLQFMLRARRDGKSLWSVFWRGGAMPNALDQNEPVIQFGSGKRGQLAQAGGALPKALTLSAAIGVWLMFTRVLFDTEGAMADSDHVIGALAIVVSISCYSEVVRPARALNMLFGAWLVVAPWVLEGANEAATIGSMVAGALLIVLALPRGPVRNHYDGWDRYNIW